MDHIVYWSIFRSEMCNFRPMSTLVRLWVEMVERGSPAAATLALDAQNLD